MVSTTPTLLVVGGCGELGWATVCAAHRTSSFNAIAATYFRKEPTEAQRAQRATKWVQLDCGDHDKVGNVLSVLKPRAVIYCAVPKHGGASGKGGDSVRRGIVDDVVHAAEVSRDVNALFIVLSTDLVFDGTLPAGKAYTENDSVSPTSNVSLEQRMQPHILLNYRFWIASSCS